MRSCIKKPLSSQAAKRIINKLMVMKSNKQDIIKILENSIIKHWQDVYEIKENIYSNNFTKDSNYIQAKLLELNPNFDYIKALKEGIKERIDNKSVGFREKNSKLEFYFL